MDSRLQPYFTSLKQITQKRIVQQRKDKPYDTSRYDAYLTMLSPLLNMTLQTFDCVPVDFSLFCRKVFDSMGPLTTKIFQNIPPRKRTFYKQVNRILYSLFSTQQMQTRQVQGFLRGRVYQNVKPMTEQQLKQLNIPDTVKQHIKKSMNAASISQVLEYSTDSTNTSNTLSIIKVIRPTSRQRFQKEVEVVHKTVLPMIKDKSVLRFIQALIDDVENEMNLEKEADNMKTAKRTNEEYSNHLTQELQRLTRLYLHPFSQMLKLDKLDKCAAANIIKQMYPSSSPPPQDITKTLTNWSEQCSHGNKRSTPPQVHIVQQRKFNESLNAEFLKIFPSGYNVKQTKGNHGDVFLLTSKSPQEDHKSVVKLFDDQGDFSNQRSNLLGLPNSSKVYFPQLQQNHHLTSNMVLKMQNRFGKATVLADFLLKNPSSTTEINTLARNLITAVTTMNKDGIFYGDIKPENIIVSPHLDIQFIDAGSITIVTPDVLQQHRKQEEQYTKKNNQKSNLFLIPKVLDGEYDQNYIIMERVNGTTLAKLLEKGSITPVHYQCLQNLVRTYVGFINTLSPSQYYIFHADLHPGNIMFSTSVQKTTMTIIDWGRVVKIEDDTARSDAKMLLLFYKLRQDYLDREDELLLVCRMFAPFHTNAEYYFYWLDKFYVPRQQDLDIHFKFYNIYRWLQNMEQLVNGMKERIFKVMVRREYTNYKSFLSTDPHDVMSLKSLSRDVSDKYDLLEVRVYMQKVYLFIRNCFQYSGDLSNENKLRHFLNTTIEPQFQDGLNQLLREGDKVLQDGIEYLAKQDGISFYKQMLCTLCNPTTAEINVTTCLTPDTCHVGFMLAKYFREKTKTWDKDFQRVAEHFKIRLPDSKTFNSHTYEPKLLDLDLQQQTKQEIVRTWTSALDLKKAVEDKSLYPLSDTSTFMRIFDAFQRLEQTLQITWDKVSTVQKLGSKKKTPPVITDFLS